MIGIYPFLACFFPFKFPKMQLLLQVLPKFLYTDSKGREHAYLTLQLGRTIDLRAGGIKD